MDLLFRRYADPFSLLNELILMGDFSRFINTVMEEYNEDLLWQYFLSRIFDKSFNDFKEGLKTSETPTESDIETTIQESMSMTMNFVPDQVRR